MFSGMRWGYFFQQREASWLESPQWSHALRPVVAICARPVFRFSFTERCFRVMTISRSMSDLADLVPGADPDCLDLLQISCVRPDAVLRKCGSDQQSAGRKRHGRWDHHWAADR